MFYEEPVPRPYLATFVLWFSLGAVFTLFQRLITPPDPASMPLGRAAFSAFFMLMQVGLYTAAALQGANWIAYYAGVRYRAFREAKAITPASILADKLRGLPDEALRIIRTELHGEQLTAEESDQGMTEVYDRNNNMVSVPNSFVKKFFLASKGNFLPPVRDFAEGTNARMYASALTDHLVRERAATPASGRYSARVKTFHEAMRAIHWE